MVLVEESHRETGYGYSRDLLSFNTVKSEPVVPHSLQAVTEMAANVVHDKVAKSFYVRIP